MSGQEFEDFLFWKRPALDMDLSDDEDDAAAPPPGKPQQQQPKAQAKAAPQQPRTLARAEAGSVAVGNLYCQLHPFAKSLTTKVLKCTNPDDNKPKQEAPKKSGKKKKGKGKGKGGGNKAGEGGGGEAKAAAEGDGAPKGEVRYEVLLDDTVLFPTGGGQPNDLGTIGGVAVVDVFRRGDTCVHVTHSPLKEGAAVDVVVDWDRRFHHMQQHSGQHVLSAVFEKECGLKTVSWELGAERSNIELDGESVTTEQLAAVEAIVNEHIRNAESVQAVFVDPKTDKEKLRGSKLPKDVSGPVRLVEINGVDSCTCCGIHVQNTAQLQVCKILRTERKRGQLCVWFVFGLRAIALMGECVERERQMTSLLNTNPNQHAANVEKLQASNKEMTRATKALSLELAQLLAPQLAQTMSAKGVCVHHRTETTFELTKELTAKATALAPKAVLCVVAGEWGKEGSFVVCGDAARVKAKGDKVVGLLQGSAGGKDGMLLGKIAKLPKEKEGKALLAKIEEALAA